MITIDPTLEADLRKVMIGRGIATEDEALRTVVQEAARAVESSEEAQRQRREAIKSARGSWAGRGPDLPRMADGTVNWGTLKDEIYEGMP